VGADPATAVAALGYDLGDRHPLRCGVRVLQIDPAADLRSRTGANRFILYVEGPQDRAILRAWAYRLLPSFARRLFDESVILGGRRPARAIEHFRRAGGLQGGVVGLCVLDRDDGVRPDSPIAEPGLELFTWGRRHIESYLLVPGAIARALRLSEGDSRVDRTLGEHLPDPADESAYRQIDAKRLIGPRGALARALDRRLPLQAIARATRDEELHSDVHALFDLLRARVEPRSQARGRNRA
jgi:hypothetical protein